MDLSQKWTKYFIIFWVVLIVTVVCSMLTYHAVLFSMLPVIYSGLYSSKNISRYACVLSVICTAIIVFVGYYNGICDTNMVLLTSEPLDVYVGADGEFALHSINDNVFYTLTMYYVVPRCIILFLFTMVCRNISNIIVNNIFRSKELEKKAEID